MERVTSGIAYPDRFYAAAAAAAAAYAGFGGSPGSSGGGAISKFENDVALLMYGLYQQITWGNRILSITGHTKDPSETLTVKAFDPQTCLWSNLKTYGKSPMSRGGQSVTVVGATLVILGGEDAKRSLLNDLHILDLETMTWDDIDAIGIPPAPRSNHAAACHAERYLLIFGGGSHTTCFNDLHILDLQNME